MHRQTEGTCQRVSADAVQQVVLNGRGRPVRRKPRPAQIQGIFRKTSARSYSRWVHLALGVATLDNASMTQYFPERTADGMRALLLTIPGRRTVAVVAAVLFSSPVFCQEPVSPKAAVHREAEKLTALVENLGAADFKRRATASKELKQLTADEIRTLAALSVEQPSAEVIIRLLAEVDARYASGDEETVRAASTALEALAETTRLVLAEAANESLRQHWQTRIDLAITELVKHGAHVKNGSFAKGTMGRWLPQNSVGTVNVFIDENWRGGADGLKVFARLTALTGRKNIVGGLRVYLLDGHPLTDKQHITLTAHVGQERLAERSRVALGIRPHSVNLERGVLIQTVTRGSTAAAAKLQPGDLLLGLKARLPNPPKDNVPQPSDNLRDFDELVERLKQFRPGDVVYLTVIRDFRMTAGPGRLLGRPNLLPRPEPQPDDQEPDAEKPKSGEPDSNRGPHGEEIVEVTLKGWHELETDGQ
jgi:hypothetical protein